MPVELSHELKLDFPRDAVARQDFISSLRGYILDDMARTLKARYEDTVRGEVERRQGGPPQTQDEVHEAMRRDLFFRYYSSVRYNAQEMVWRSVIPTVASELPELERRFGAVSGRSGGSLTLDPTLPTPKNVAGLDVHLMPGGYAPSDTLAPGAVYDNGLAVFSAGMMGGDLDDIGQSMANYIRHRFPEFRPARVLDCGATVGHNSCAWAAAYPQAEVHAIDVSAALMRYAHARAESLGLPVHFHQMDATRLAFPDESFDVVFSSMFLHELSVKDIRAFFAEAHRVLRPGGLLLNMELPPNRELSPYDQFYLDWDCYYNKEPFYRAFRDQDPRALVEAGGFRPEDFLQLTTPQYSYMSDEAYAARVNAPPEIGQDTGRLSSAVHWFGFGAWKAPRQAQ